MKIIAWPIILLLLLNFVSCGMGDEATDGEESATASVADDGFMGDEDFVVDSDSEDLMLAEGEEDLFASEGDDDPFAIEETTDISMQPEEDIFAADPATREVAESQPAAAPSYQDTGSGTYGSYTVKEGETLMLVAFKTTGNYLNWHKLARQNPQINPHSLNAGDVIKFEKPSVPFSWDPQGLPHLIKRGETLGTISNDKYGTFNRWRDLWDNNKPMIQDPNLIFAGFTLYYIPQRDLASQ